MLNLPQDFKNKYQNLLGTDEVEKMFQAMDNESKKAYRINPLKFNQKVSYAENHPVPNIKKAYYADVSGLDPEWVSGTVYSQDPSAMFPAAIANIKPGEKVLDLCAAPGGKSTALGQALEGNGILVANEISASRAKVLRENIERWGITNALITNNDSFALAKNFEHYFDKIVVDAPCSGEGMFRKNPEAIEYWSPEYVLTCQKRQIEILEQAVKMLKPGGQLVYSTCTFSPEEDEEIVSWLVKEYQMEILTIDSISLEKVSHGNPAWGSVSGLENTIRFWPQDDLGEGQFAALLKLPESKIETEKVRKAKKSKKKASLSKETSELIAKVLKNFKLPIEIENWDSRAQVRNDHVFIPAIDKSRLKRLKILNNGLELGILKKNRFEPGHQLAEALGQVEQTYRINLSSEDEYKKYLHGETLRVDTSLKGFVLVSYHDFIFSFGKVTGNGVLKNFYPKGLRI